MARKESANTELLILSTCASIGGTERAILCLARGLQDRGLLVSTALPVTPDTAATLEWFHREGVIAEATPAVLDLAARHRLSDILALQRYIRHMSPSHVNIHFGGEHMSLKDLIAIRASGRRRCVVTIHHAVPVRDRRRRLLTRVASYLADEVVVHTPAMKHLLTDYGCPPAKIRVIPLGVPPPRSQPTRMAARQRLGLPSDAFVVVTLARLIAHKGVGDLIDAFARLTVREPHALLVIAGDGPLRGDLETKAQRQLGPHAKFLGHVEHTHDVYASANLFALSSYEEGFGLVFIEAAFHGVPSIGPSVGGVASAIVDGETGILVSPGDLDGLARSIERFRSHVAWRNQLGMNAKRRAYSTFTEATMANRYAELFSVSPDDPVPIPSR